MTDPNFDRKEMLDEIINRKKMGDKKFHSETSLQHYNEDEDSDFSKDPGVCIKFDFIILNDIA